MLELFGLPTLTLDRDKEWIAKAFKLVGLVFPGPQIVDAASPEAYPVIKMRLQRGFWAINDSVFLVEEHMKGSWIIRDINAAFLVTHITHVTQMPIYDWPHFASAQGKTGWFRLIVSRGFLRDIQRQSHELLEKAYG